MDITDLVVGGSIPLTRNFLLESLLLMMIDCTPHSIQTIRSGRVGFFLCPVFKVLLKVQMGVCLPNLFDLSRDDLLASLLRHIVDIRQSSHVDRIRVL